MVKGQKLDDAALVAMHADFSAGVMTGAEIGVKYGVSAARVCQLAKKHRWHKNLAPVIVDTAARKLQDEDAKLRREARGVLKAATEAEVVEETAAMQVEIRREQRAHLREARDLVIRLIEELRETTGNLPMLQAVAEMVAKNDPAAAMELAKVISLPSRATVMDRLTNALTKLIAAETDAFGLKPPEQRPGGSIEDFIRGRVQGA